MRMVFCYLALSTHSYNTLYQQLPTSQTYATELCALMHLVLVLVKITLNLLSVNII